MSLHAGQFPLSATPVVPMDPIYRLSVDQYHELIDQGILASGDPVELLEGWLVHTMSKNPRHSSATRRTRLALSRALPPGFFVDSQEPVTTEDSEPEPDVCVTRGDERRYENRHPQASDVPLIIEVADSSLETDRRTKQRVYARAGFPVYWIINLIDDVVEVYTSPSGPCDSPSYALRAEFRPGASLPLVIDGVEVAAIPVSDILH